MFCGRGYSDRLPVDGSVNRVYCKVVETAYLCCWFALVFECDIATETASFGHSD
jgi:hypothetical protein